MSEIFSFQRAISVSKMLKLLTAMLATFQNQSQTDSLLNSSGLRGFTDRSSNMLTESRAMLSESASCLIDGNETACDAIQAKTDAMLAAMNEQATRLSDSVDQKAQDVKSCFADDDVSPHCKGMQSVIHEAKVNTLGIYDYSATVLGDLASELCFSVEQARMRVDLASRFPEATKPQIEACVVNLRSADPVSMEICSLELPEDYNLARLRAKDACE